MALPVFPKDDRAERKQIEMLRAAGTAARSELGMALSARAIELAHQAIGRRHPELSEQDVKLKFVELHYGADLAAKVREYLARRAR